MCFFYLLLGHLLGDFVLQTDNLAENKAKYPKWNLFHTAIVTACILLFAIPFGISVMLLVLAGGVMHYFIDYYKPVISQRYPLPGLVYFLGDQGLHILILYLTSLFAAADKGYSFIDPRLIDLMIIIGFVSSFSAVLSQYILGLFFKATTKRFFEKYEKGIGNFTRVITAFGLYLTLSYSPLFLLAVAFVLFSLYQYYNRNWQSWMEPRYFAVKLLTDAVISFTGLFCLLLFKLIP